MQKSNKSIAGYHLLMILSMVDYKFNADEELVIKDYMATEFPFRMNLDDEMEKIAALQPFEWRDHFTFHAQCFCEDSTEEERKNFFEFAQALVGADGELDPREDEYLEILKSTCNL
ncbi:MAG: TerB family tellurite resistance protein [Chryseobacterium sp.]|nr:MAG: TerB family tellurite resistance protein [Chryseobacterium sp.]